MMMEESLRTFLVGDPALLGLVGQRVFWNHIPQNTADPCVVLYKIDGVTGLTMGGDDGLERARVQIDVRALVVTTSANPPVIGAWNVSRAIKARLSGFRGTQGDTEFAGIFLLSERQSSEKPETVLYHRVSLDIEVWSKSI